MNATETEHETRLRRARESLDHCRENERVARIALADAVRRTAAAKERFETMFAENERHAAAAIRKATTERT